MKRTAGGVAATPRTTAAEPATPAGPAAPGGLYASPEYLIRRAHQIMSAAFVEACADLELTPSQYAALFALRQRGSVSQNELGRLIALDRSTMSTVVKSLRDRALVQAAEDPLDRRKTVLSLVDAGRLVLAKAEKRSANAAEMLARTLGHEKTRLLLALLQELANHHPAG